MNVSQQPTSINIEESDVLNTMGSTDTENSNRNFELKKQTQSGSISSSSSVLTNSYTSPSSSLTSIAAYLPNSANFNSNTVSDSICNSSSNSTMSESDKSNIINNQEDLVEYEQEPRHNDIESTDMLRETKLSEGEEPTSSAYIAAVPREVTTLLDYSSMASANGGLLFLREDQKLEMHGRYAEIAGTASMLGADICQASRAARVEAISNNDNLRADASAIVAAIDDSCEDDNERLAVAQENEIKLNRLTRDDSCGNSEVTTVCSVDSRIIDTRSVSHENLANSDQISNHAFITPPLDKNKDFGSTSYLNNLENSEIQIQQNLIDDTDICPSSTTNHQQLATSKTTYEANLLDHVNSKQQVTGSSFFSSKLNTGSLWSLLSVGSTSSTSISSNVNEMTNVDNTTDEASRVQKLDGSSTSNKDQDEQQDKNQAKTSFRSGFFSKVQQFKRQTSASQEVSPQRQVVPSNIDNSNDTTTKRFRFNVKYIGSAMLHKNFTLPMLEWIARDIKRQTVKGAPNTSHRQFTIPARDIILEIQSYQLVATSCKDRHRIFVHPMHCVSKYAQLQHDPNCFSYLIRDTKESPYFCHVFQAKSTPKVHEIFAAIREATTTRITKPQTPLISDGRVSNQNLNQDASRGVQRSASSDGQVKSLFGQVNDRNNHVLMPLGQRASQASKDTELKPVFPSPLATTVQVTRPNNHNEPDIHFDNSYQFEVMFVKKVKLQCRRVPTSFVDDALETLKSFDVLKGGDSKAQIKGVGKRIISASVDERQEYDEACQSPTPTIVKKDHLSSQNESDEIDERRGSSVSLDKSQSIIKEERESRSCQQSPAKVNLNNDKSIIEIEGTKHNQSMGSLNNIDRIVGSSKAYNAPHYSNDFSPYNTITSSDLNERIAAIPVVSGSASLDHETRQKLARQVRETIMATAANIKKDVYASRDKLDSGSSLKVLDSLSCTAVSYVPPIENDQPLELDRIEPSDRQSQDNQNTCDPQGDHRRSSAGPLYQSNSQATNNFDLFRRASSRQVVKNRTMLLLIGKDELCTISIDRHQVLFSKSFSSIVHCLQGYNNRDHFGLICRDSGKINPNTESYAGLIFKCQSEKVVREIMGALKQVIYNSQHNYHGCNSIYNPLNTVQQSMSQSSIKMTQGNNLTSVVDMNKKQINHSQDQSSTSLATKRGFSNHLEFDAVRSRGQPDSPKTASSTSSVLAHTGSTVKTQPKNLIKSMFCDNCPLYWYHRLCCDIESLPPEDIKAIIMRRIHSSLGDREQDELYSRFSEFNIDSIDEHNEIFMSLLRQICERNQLKHNQSQAHQATIAKNNPNLVKQSTLPSFVSRQSSIQNQLSGSSTSNVVSNEFITNTFSKPASGHQRSGSSSGSLGFVIGQGGNQSISEAGTAAMDNLKRAKNTISVSIENMLKRRSSCRDDNVEQQADEQSQGNYIPMRSGSFRSASRDARTTNTNVTDDQGATSLKRSSSTSDYPSNKQLVSSNSIASWKDSLSRTINDDVANPLMGLFRRRSSTFGDKDGIENSRHPDDLAETRASSECLNRHQITPKQQPSSPSISDNRLASGLSNSNVHGGSSPSSMLSSAFWKKSIFDKIRQPQHQDESNQPTEVEQRGKLDTNADPRGDVVQLKISTKRSSEQLRSLWRKAILEQITLLKMDKQNQRLQANTAECDIQRIKLNYKDVPYKRDALVYWDRLLKQNPTKKVVFVEVAKWVRYGVPKHRRGEIWMFLMNQYQLRHGVSFQPSDCEYRGDANQNYRSLLSQLSMQQHEIFVDIGRTFPTHPYYSQYLSIGQLSLFNLLKAFSLLDQEVGYCQGLSFVAGILLLHVNSEDEAFELMRHLLFNFGLRKQYLPSMNALHLQLYQLTRLLRDHEFALFNHFDRQDISPSLYAAPWFLTLFASQFPLGFVARLLDLIFLMGIEAIFRVSLNLLAYHRAAILNCKSLESTMDFMRSDLVKIEDKDLVTIFDKCMSMDLRNELIEYEIEYTFYCAEEKARSASKYLTAQQRDNLSGDKEVGADKIKAEIQNSNHEATSVVANATATVIIQHLLANNHLKSLQSNYSY